MPAYHSKKNSDGYDEACSCSICPLRTTVKGPAPPALPDTDDIIDEVLNLFRANVLFRNYDVKGGADRTLIYLTLHCCQCLVRCEKIEDKPTAVRELRALSSTKQFALPGEANFCVGGLFTAPKNKAESELWRTYFKQAREELAIRLCDKLFEGNGSKSKWWQSFSKKKFMGKVLQDF